MVGTFPLNVQAGSPQYTTIGEITPSSSTTSIAIDNPNYIELISNAYYTIQNADGSKWCTFYVEEWVPEFDGVYFGHCTYSSSNTSDVFPGGSICWCIWCKEYYDSITSAIPSTQTGIPSGAIMAFATSSAPDGWLLCDGSAVSRTTYAGLFAAISTLYGSGDGSTTFNLPNLQGKMVLGIGGAHDLGDTGGSETVTLTIPQMPYHTHSSTISIDEAGVHTHNMQLPNSSRDDPGNRNAGTSSNKASIYSSEYVSSSGNHTHSATCNITSTGSSQPHSNMPPYLVLIYCIKT